MKCLGNGTKTSPAPPSKIGPSLNSDFKLLVILDFPRVAFAAGNMIDLHSFSVRVQHASRYLGFAEILVARAVQAADLEGLVPNDTYHSQSTAASLSTDIILVLSPLGDIHTPPSFLQIHWRLDISNSPLFHSVLLLVS